MGQTLTHGVYLPDEGERNCYSGLAANWQLLDGAVGTIAEHTTALAGKAPAIHTHVKADITDFPAYGNAAGTICEGNDSRLSDARTPVAHTHTKSDVTDLLNSNFIPSANNSYDLGSSSYQWNNVYSKNYFYNGTAWGLDKANTWSKVNTFTSILCFQWLSSGGYSDFRFQDQNADTQFILRCYSNDVTFSKRSANGSNAFQGSQINFKDNGNLTIQTYDGTDYRVINFTPTSVHPSSSSAQDLGTSTNKWKSLNGINPGALSLPDSSKSETIDTTGYTDSNNFYWTPSSDGWLFVNINHCSLASIKTQIGEYYINQPSGWYRNTVPVAKNKRVILLFACSSSDIPILTFYPCLGNV